MFCQKCGNQIPDGSNNCTFCGAPQKTSTGLETGVPVSPHTPQPPKKNNNTILIAIIAALIVIVLVVVGIFVIKPAIENNNSGSSQSEEKDDDDDKDKDKDKDKNKEEKTTRNRDSNNKDEDIDEPGYQDIDVDDAEAELEEFLDVLYNPNSQEFEMWLTDDEGIENVDETTALGVMTIAMTVMNRDYSILSYEAESNDSYSFTVKFEIADFYEAAELFKEIIAYEDEEISKDKLLDELFDCVEDAGSSYCELDVIMCYDDDMGWYVENQDEIIISLAEDIEYAFDF